VGFRGQGGLGLRGRVVGMQVEWVGCLGGRNQDRRVWIDEERRRLKERWIDEERTFKCVQQARQVEEGFTDRLPVDAPIHCRFLAMSGYRVSPISFKVRSQLNGRWIGWVSSCLMTCLCRASSRMPVEPPLSTRPRPQPQPIPTPNTSTKGPFFEEASIAAGTAAPGPSNTLYCVKKELVAGEGERQQREEEEEGMGPG